MDCGFFKCVDIVSFLYSKSLLIVFEVFIGRQGELCSGDNHMDGV